MHGEIELESTLGQGTIARFWIPFNKAPYQDDGSPLVDLSSIPDRLQSDVSVSYGSSEDRPSPPLTPTLHDSRSNIRGRSGFHSGQPGTPPHISVVNQPVGLSDIDRNKTHILVVEDK